MKTTIEELNKRKQERLSKLPTLRFEETFKPSTLSEILFELLNANPMKFYASNTLRGKRITYNSISKRKFGNFNRRSIEDAFRICRTYIPNITYNKLYEVINKLRSGGVIDGDYCFTCKKTVFGTSNKNLDTFKNRLERLDIKVE
jgi:hypothetical protein